MCGIVGVIGDLSAFELRNTTTNMAKRIKHRGPDHSATWRSDGVCLGSCRLAIVDAVERSNQPYVSKDGGRTLVYNGEVFNFKEIRSLLKKNGLKFDSESDTEVVFQALSNWGISSLNSFNGMWALGYWDQGKRTILLARDRFGEKPLYWLWNKNRLYFSSEIKSFKAINDFRFVMNTEYFANYFHKESVDATDLSPILGVKSLPPGHYLELKAGGVPQITKWWQLPTEDLYSEKSNVKDIYEHFRELFIDSVNIRIPLETKFAASLSGGLDSTSIAGCLTQLAHSNPKTFKDFEFYSLALTDSKLDESVDASRSVQYFGGKLNLVRYEDFNLRSQAEEALWHQESLVWNSSLLAFHQFYKGLSLNGIKVVLEGHGSDEYMGGYPYFTQDEMYYSLLRFKYKNIFDLKAQLLASSNPIVGERDDNFRFSFIRNLIRPYLGESLRALSTEHKNDSTYNFNFGLIEKSLLSQHSPFRKKFMGSLDLKERLAISLESKTLPHVLRVFDRATMAYGIESRSPYLDHRLVEFVFSLPSTLLRVELGRKPLVRHGLSSLLTDETKKSFVKRGFAGNLDIWLRHADTIDHLSRVYENNELIDVGYVNIERYRGLIDRVKRGSATTTEGVALWQAFSFGVWYSLFVD